ncbi:MAG: zinc-ribbon domain-containing protein [Candidatus Freyarchaeota archaeon]|nr:zinc ribbon domain-containing protein [Candidatus Freyrarchaeum guaymaensis]
MSSSVRVLMDEFHNEQTRLRIYNELKNRMVTEWGIELYINASSPITQTLLEQYSALVIIGPRKGARGTEFKLDELFAVVKFAEEGGIVLFTPSPNSREYKENFVNKLGIDYMGASSKLATDFSPHPFVKGVSKLQAPWFRTTMTTLEWTPIVRVPLGVRSFPVVALREYGEGAFIYVSSVMLFSQNFLRKFDNARLVENIFTWIRDSGKKMYVEEERVPTEKVTVPPPSEAKKFCPHCGSEVPPYAIYCPNCGASLE